MIRVQSGDFDIGKEIEALRKGPTGDSRTDIGAIVTFTGTVRDTHGMTECSDRHDPRTLSWHDREGARTHRDGSPCALALGSHADRPSRGPLEPGDNIVLVITASAHRDAAFEAASFLMDYLKTSAPFWKRESGPEGKSWVDAKKTDDEAAARWRRRLALPPSRTFHPS